MSTDVRAWITGKIPSMGELPGLGRLSVLISQERPRVWQAKGLERRVVATNGSPYAAYQSLQHSIRADAAAGFPVIRQSQRASVSSHQRFSDAPNLLSLMNTIAFPDQPLHAVVYLDEHGWKAVTLEEYFMASARNCPAEAYTDLVRTVHAALTGEGCRMLKEILNPQQAAPEFWTMCESPGHEAFGRPIPQRAAASA